MSAVSSMYHVVINTYRRQMTIPDETSEHLYRYIWSIVKSRGCRLYRINGIGNHIHMLIELSPTIALSDLVRDIFSCSWRDKERMVSYIINQRQHHQMSSFEEEYRQMLELSGLEWNDKRLT